MFMGKSKPAVENTNLAESNKRSGGCQTEENGFVRVPATLRRMPRSSGDACSLRWHPWDNKVEGKKEMNVNGPALLIKMRFLFL